MRIFAERGGAQRARSAESLTTCLTASSDLRSEADRLKDFVDQGNAECEVQYGIYLT
jgi:hypothetical protein